jgi:hypothetical protein
MALLTVTESFADFRSGHPEVYNPGRLVDEKDPVVKGREAYFEPADAAASRVRVESATAAPGERRERSRPAKKAAAKRAPVKAAPKKETAKKAAAKIPDSPLPTGDNAPADPPSSEVL